MKHVKLFEGFLNEGKKKDEVNKSIKKVNEDDKEDKIETELAALFKELVPPQGPAKTIEGEMVRAIMRIWYRYFNDGDYFFRGYGKETAGPSASYLKTQTPISKVLKTVLAAAQAKAGKADNDDEYTEKDEYLNKLKEAAEMIIKYVKSKDGKYTENTGKDSR
jgi:hypothetical protein